MHVFKEHHSKEIICEKCYTGALIDQYCTISIISQTFPVITTTMLMTKVFTSGKLQYLS